MLAFSTRVNNLGLTLPEVDLLQNIILSSSYASPDMNDPHFVYQINKTAEYTHCLQQPMYNHSSEDMILKVHCQSKKILSRERTVWVPQCKCRDALVARFTQAALAVVKEVSLTRNTHTVQSLTENHVRSTPPCDRAEKPTLNTSARTQGRVQNFGSRENSKIKYKLKPSLFEAPWGNYLKIHRKFLEK